MKISETYSLYAHLSKFSSEQVCYDYLVQTRWRGKPECPDCRNNHMNYFLATRNIYKCSECYKQFSVKQGTIFEKSRIPLQKWFMAIYIFTTYKRSISSCQMAKVLGIKQHAAWLLMHKLREALKQENEIILSGIVEADEVFIGPKIHRDLRLIAAKQNHEKEQERIHGLTEEQARKRRGYPIKSHRQKGVTKEVIAQRKLEQQLKGERTSFEKPTVIFGMVERGGKLVMKTLGNNAKSVNKKEIYPLLKQHIQHGSLLITDNAGVYKSINFFTHLTVNHNKTFVTEDGTHTNNIENAWKHLRKLIDGTYFHISFRHVDRYLDETTYRWNRRNESLQCLFDDFINLSINKGITYSELINGDENKLAA